MSEWQTVAIGEICDLVTSGGTPLTSQKEYYHNGSIPWVKTKEVNQCRLYGTENHITQLGLDNSSAKLIPENSIIIAMYGDGKTAGRVALNKVPVTTNQACCNLILNKQKANYDFVFYNLMGRYDELVSKKTGSGQQNLNGKIIKEIEIDLPSLPEQKAIASVLSSLDDKIDLLHRQNKTLEAMAETLFRQWFIEEAKEDWEDKQLGTLLTVKRGGSPRPIQDYLSDSGYRWLKISDVTSLNSPFVFNIKEHIKEEGLSKTTLLQAGKLVLSNSATPAIPKILMVDTCIHDGWLHFPVSSYSNEYLYLLFNHIRPELLQLGNGSIFTNLKTDILKEYVVKHPDEATLLKFQTVIEPIFTKLLENAKQIQTLEKLRDTLLPKLMSGEVRVQYQTEQVA